MSPGGQKLNTVTVSTEKSKKWQSNQIFFYVSGFKGSSGSHLKQWESEDLYLFDQLIHVYIPLPEKVRSRLVLAKTKLRTAALISSNLCFYCNSLKEQPCKSFQIPENLPPSVIVQPQTSGYFIWSLCDRLEQSCVSLWCSKKMIDGVSKFFKDKIWKVWSGFVLDDVILGSF